jgi:site-specific DNA recombinase
VVIFDDLKRFARDVEVHLRLKSELKAREASLRCLNYNFDDSAEGEFVETIFAAQNQLERKQNRRQVCQKMKARVENGCWCFGQPAGYEYKRDKAHGKLLTPIHPVTDVLAKGLIDFAEDRLLTQTDFLQYLVSQNFHGLLGRDRKKIDYEFIKSLLVQPLYAGIIEYQKWGISKRKGLHEAIISEETFRKIQNKLKKPERKPRETDNLEFPLRRVVSCAFCGLNMTGSVSRGKRKYYAHYTCNNKECKASPKNISASKMEEEYFELLSGIKLEPELLKVAEEIVTRIWNEKVQNTTLSQETAQAEIQAIEKEITEYIKLIPGTQSQGLRVRYEARVEELDQQLKQLEGGLKNKKVPNFEEARDLALRFLGTPAETWQNALKEVKNMVHNMIFEVNPSYCLKDGFGTPHLTLPFSIKEHILAVNANLVDLTGLEPVTSSMPWKRSTK